MNIKRWLKLGAWLVVLLIVAWFRLSSQGSLAKPLTAEACEGYWQCNLCGCGCFDKGVPGHLAAPECQGTPGNPADPGNCTLSYSGNSFTLSGNNCNTSYFIEVYNGDVCPTNADNGEKVAHYAASNNQTYSPNPPLGKCQQVDHVAIGQREGGGVCSCAEEPPPPPSRQCGQSCGGNIGNCSNGLTCQAGQCVLNTCASNPTSCAADKCSILSIAQCGGACGPNTAICPSGQTCTNSKCVLDNCLANPSACTTDMCQPLPTVQCGADCGPNTGLCPSNNTCQSGKCVLNTCLPEDAICKPNKCELLPTAECGEACGLDKALCPSGNVCKNGGCVLDVCADSPELCKPSLCELEPLPPQCLNITPSTENISLGDEVSFTCSEVENAVRYEFNALYLTSKNGEQGQTLNLQPASSTSNISNTVKFDRVGRFVVQCRPCSANNLCASWEPLSALSGGGN